MLYVLSLIGSLLWIYYLLQRTGVRTPRVPSLRAHKWNKKLAADPLDAVNDPKEAALMLMIGMAECEGLISSGQKQKVLELAERVFQLSEPEAIEYFTSASFLLRKTPSLERLVRTMAPVIDRYCDDNEKRELLSMMREVAEADGSPLNADQQAMLENTAKLLKIA